MQQESAGNANAVNETSDGRFTVGLFQIHTSTWKTWYERGERREEGARDERESKEKRD